MAAAEFDKLFGLGITGEISSIVVPRIVMEMGGMLGEPGISWRGKVDHLLAREQV